MTSYLNRISHFKGNPREIGFTAGCTFASKLGQTISHYIANVEDSKDLENCTLVHYPGCVLCQNDFRMNLKA